jgi:hypothetical protein
MPYMVKMGCYTTAVRVYTLFLVDEIKHTPYEAPPAIPTSVLFCALCGSTKIPSMPYMVKMGCYTTAV